MGAQSAHEPSMEDILASIRKIISEDSKEDAGPKNASPDVAAQNSAQEPEQEHGTSFVPPLVTGNTPEGTLNQNSVEPPVLQARRQLFEQSENGFSPAAQPPVFANSSPASPDTSSSAPENVTPVNETPVNDTPLQSYRDRPASVMAVPKTDELSAPKGNMGGHGHFDGSEINDASPQVPSQRPLPPTVRNDQIDTQSTNSSASLHPAIENAKAFVANRQQQISTPLVAPEKPVFSQSQLSANSSVSSAKLKPMISPESLERREAPDRRNHPLRRGDDREEQEFKNALTSPQSAFATRPDHTPALNQPGSPDPAPVENALMSAKTGDAVSNALDQLKNSTLDGVDEKVEALLRPMLREWLDNNLPSMVERLVRDEIERVSRGS